MDLITAALAVGAGALAMRGYDRVRVELARPRGLPGSLPWGYFVAPGTVHLKDGAFLRGFNYRGPDSQSATNAELNALSSYVTRGLHPFYNDWMLHFDASRLPTSEYAQTGAFPDDVSRAMDEERRREYTRRGQKFETRCVVSLTGRPPRDSAESLRRLLVRGEEFTSSWQGHLHRFQTDGVERLMDKIGSRLRMEPLGSDEYMSHLHYCLTGLTHKVLAPPDHSHLDWALASQEFVRGTRPQVGDKHICVVSFFGYPPETWCGLLETLTGVGAPYRWSTRIIPLGNAAAARIVSRIRDTWFKNRQGAATLTHGLTQGGENTAQKAEDAKVFENSHARKAATMVGELLGSIQSGDKRAALFTSTLVVHGDTWEEARGVARLLVNEVNDRGFTARIERTHACPAFFSSMPGDGWHNLRRPPLPVEGVADLLPVTASWAGAQFCPSPFFPPRSAPLAYVDTEDSTAFRLNLHHDDMGNSLLVGAPGMGKSTFMGFCVSSFMRYPNAQVFWFDKGYSGYLLTAAMGGRHYDIRPKPDPRHGLQFQPYARVDEAEELVWAVEWTETACHLHGIEPNLARREKIQRALEVLAARPKRERTMRTFVKFVQDHDVRAAMEQYTGSGPYGYLLDGSVDGFADGRVHTFEMHRLMSLGEAILVPVLLHLFRQTELRMRANLPTFIPIDEAWEALLRSLFADKIEEWLRTVRKMNGMVMLATQDPADIANADKKDIILNTCQTRIFLPNPNAVSQEVAEQYRAYLLNDREVQIVAEGRFKRDYFFKNPGGSRRFELRLGPVALAFLGSRKGMTTAAAVQHARDLEADHGAEWPRIWLREAGLERQAEDLFPRRAPAAAAA